MIGTIITAIFSFASTNIDDIFILMLFFSQVGDKLKKSHIVIGQYLGIMTLLFVSILGSIGLNLISQQYIGLLGVIPILLGIKEWLKYRKEKKNVTNSESVLSNSVMEKNGVSKDKMLDELNTNTSAIKTTRKEKTMLGKFIHPAIINVFLVTASNGADNIGVYIPLFTSMNLIELIVTVIIFLLLIAVWCFVGEKLINIPTIKNVIQKYKNVIVPIVFIVIGVYIIVGSDLLSFFR